MADEDKYSQEEMDLLLERYRKRTGNELHYSQRTGKTKTITNPEYAALDPVEQKMAERGLLDRAVPKTIEVPITRWQNADVLVEAYIEPGTGQYVVTNTTADITPSSGSSVGPEQRAKAEEDAKRERDEKSWNLNNGPNSMNPATGQPYGSSAPGSGLAETHKERTTREYGQEDQTFQRNNQEAARRAEDRQIEAQRQQAEQQRKANELAQQKFDYDVEKDQRPQLAGTPNDSTKNIAVWDPMSQTLSSVENPMYDEAKAQAARLKDQLSTGIALNQITAQQAAQQYKQWWDTNVELPFKQAAEVRARATEQREALAAEDRRKQFASDFSLRRNTLGFNAGDAAVKNEISLLPYRAGPTEATEMASAITSLGQGGKIAGPDASAGIHFTPEAFQFDRPDFDKIAQKATKNALKGITKYTPEGTFSQGDYSGISMPSGQGAPSSTGGGIDLSTLWNQYLQNGVAPYQGPQDDAQG